METKQINIDVKQKLSKFMDEFNPDRLLDTPYRCTYYPTKADHITIELTNQSDFNICIYLTKADNTLIIGNEEYRYIELDDIISIVSGLIDEELGE